MSIEAMIEPVSWGLSPLLIPLTSTILILSVFYWYQQQSHIFKLGNKIPGPTPLPFLGNALLILAVPSGDQLLKKAFELINYYGNVTRGWIGSNLLVALTDPADIELILGSSLHITKSDEYRFFKPWLGDGLLISSGDRWRHHRKLIAPAFHQNVLKSFIGTFNSNSLNVVDKLRKEIGKEFDVHDYMSEITVDILLETAMGHERTGKNQEGYNYAMAVMKMCDILHQRHTKLLYRYDRIFNLTTLKRSQEKLLGVIHGLTTKVIKKKKSIYEKNVSEGIFPTPSFKEVVMNDYKETAPIKKAVGLRDDLDDNDENDVGKYICLFLFPFPQIKSNFFFR